ncbi:MAG: glycosyltransferase, partial [Clostridia bacterium]|nr:glycosyltransferase [Clostridia bacterium]
MKLSLVIPCYNEADNVRPLFDKVNEEFENKIDDYEFIFVNDGSTDETLANLKGICEESSRPVKIVNFSRNFGKEAAIFAGL